MFLTVLVAFILGMRYADYRNGKRDPVGEKEQHLWGAFLIAFLILALVAGAILEVSEAYANVIGTLTIVAYGVRNWYVARPAAHGVTR